MKLARTLTSSRGWFAKLPRTAQVSFLVLVFWALMAILGPAIAPYGMGESISDEIFGPMNNLTWLGSDYLGRDTFSRILYGAPYTIGLSLAAAILATGTGTLLALFSVVSGGRTDEGISRIIDVIMLVPIKIFALMIVAVLGSSTPVLVLTVALAYMPGNFRIARSLALNLDTTEYVLVARLRGENRPYLVWSEILPNMLGPIQADFGIRFVYIVLTLSGLSFLGLGVQPPQADWGSLVRENMSGLFEAAPAVLAPAAAIATLTVSINLFIDGLSGRRQTSTTE